MNWTRRLVSRLLALASAALLAGCAAGLAPHSSADLQASTAPRGDLVADQTRAEAVASRLLQSYLSAEQLRQFAGRHHCSLEHADGAAQPHRQAQAALACTGFIEILDRANINASTNGDTVRVSDGLVRIASDDELAFAVGHELGHLLRGHAYALLRDRYELEMEADQMSLAMMAAAGYRPEAALHLLHQISEEHGDGFVSNTHPTEVAREQAILATLKGLDLAQR